MSNENAPPEGAPVETQPPEQAPPPGPAEPEPETPAQKRDRRTFPIRVFVKGEHGYVLVQDLAGFDTIEAADRWIDKSGADDATYMRARVIGAKRVMPRRVEEVGL